MIADNSTLLIDLIESGVLPAQFRQVLDWQPAPLSQAGNWSKVEGMLLGLAIGDALGNTSEGQPPSQRDEQHGEITYYLSNRYADGRAVGLPSDDTQLAFWTLECLLADHGLAPDHLAKRFCREHIFGIGSSVREFIANYGSGQPWERAGAKSTGNGALMRIAPVLLPHLRRPSPNLWADTVLAAWTTHRDPGSTAACVAFVRLVWEALSYSQAPRPEWWLETFCATASQLEGVTHYLPRHSNFSYAGPIWRLAQEQASAAHRSGWSARQACNDWYSGAYLLETVPSVLYILMRHAHEPREALVRAVNDTWDNDTVAAIVGAAVGALHGVAALPLAWRRDLLGRTNADNDGRVFSLIEAARLAFSPEVDGAPP